MSNLLFYVSGHGYGHAVRAAEVIHALRAIEPSANITIRTSAPETLFGEDLQGRLRVLRTTVDPIVVEQGIFKIDWEGCANNLAEFLKRRDSIVDAETAWVRELGVDRIIADIPFLAGEIAHSAEVPCIGISNFLWDWIYEPMLDRHPQGTDFLQIMHDAYARFQAVLRLPFAHEMQGVRRVVDVPLVAPMSQRSRLDILKAIGIEGADHRTIVLVGLREGFDASTLCAVASRQQDLFFLNTGTIPITHPANLQQAKVGKEVTFADAISIADVIIGKPGYGMMAACAANRKRLLYIPRDGFREDEALLRGAAECITVAPLPLQDFQTGDWNNHLRAILSRAAPEHSVDLEGARVCAEFIVGHI